MMPINIATCKTHAGKGFTAREAGAVKTVVAACSHGVAIAGNKIKNHVKQIYVVFYFVYSNI